MRGSPAYPTSRAVTVIPNWAPERVNERRPVMSSARRGGGVALVGQLPQPVPVHRDVGELLGDEVAGRDGQENDDGEADGDEHRGVHSSRAFTRSIG